MSYETLKTTTEHADIKPGQLRLILKIDLNNLTKVRKDL